MRRVFLWSIFVFSIVFHENRHWLTLLLILLILLVLGIVKIIFCYSAILLLEQVAFYSVEMVLFNCRGLKPHKPGTDEVQFMLSYQKRKPIKDSSVASKGKTCFIWTSRDSIRSNSGQHSSKADCMLTRRSCWPPHSFHSISDFHVSNIHAPWILRSYSKYVGQQ